MGLAVGKIVFVAAIGAQDTTTRMTTTKLYDALNRLYDTKSAVNGLTPAQVRYGS